jgi:hypothetical protein
MGCVPYESAAMRDVRAKAEEEKRNKDKVMSDSPCTTLYTTTAHTYITSVAMLPVLSLNSAVDSTSSGIVDSGTATAS